MSITKLACLREEYVNTLQDLREQAKEDNNISLLQELSSEGGKWNYGPLNGILKGIDSEIQNIEYEEARKSAPTISLSADELEFYSGMKGSKEAAKEISEALTVAVAKLYVWMGNNKDLERLDWGSETRVLGVYMGQVYRDVVEPVLRKHVKLGAYDTEPRYYTSRVLVDCVKKYYGYTGQTDLMEYVY